MVFIGRGFTSRGQELGPVFSAAVFRIQASAEREKKRLLTRLKFPVQLPLDYALIFLK